MPGDLEPLPARLPGRARRGPGGAGGRAGEPGAAEPPAISGLGKREQVLVSAWLTGLRSARTRRAYAGDVVAWLGWLAGRETGAPPGPHGRDWRV